MVGERKIWFRLQHASKEPRTLETLTVRRLVAGGPEDSRTQGPQGQPERGMGGQGSPRDLLIYSGRK